MRSLAVTLSFLMISSAWDAQAQTMPTLLNIVVVEGDGAINNIRQRVARDPVVRVEDENHKPIAGAAVVFTLPTEGATGDFAGQKTITVTTDAKGLAVGKSMKLNPIPGKVPIHVTASYRGLSARMTINQVAVVPPGEKAGTSAGSGHHGALIGVLVALGAAAAGGGAYFATHGSKTSTPRRRPPRVQSQSASHQAPAGFLEVISQTGLACLRLSLRQRRAGAPRTSHGRCYDHLAGVIRCDR